MSTNGSGGKTGRAGRPLCAVTGVRGYLGGRVASALAARGWDVLELTRQPARDARHAIPFRLGEEVPAAQWAGVRALVHCAYDFSLLSWDRIRQVNVEGARRLLEGARSAGVERVVAISSLSAFEGCRSFYGRAKLEMEKLALAQGALVVRPGLIYGDHPRGMFGRLVAQVAQGGLIPLVGGGRQLQYLTHEADLCDFILAFAEGRLAAPARAIIAAHEQPWTFRRILEEIARSQGRPTRFVPVPWWGMWLGIRLAEACGLRLPFRSDSLIGLRYPNPRPDFAGNHELGLRCRAFTL